MKHHHQLGHLFVLAATRRAVTRGRDGTGDWKAPRQLPPLRQAVAVRVWGLAASGHRPPLRLLPDGTCVRLLDVVPWHSRSRTGQGRLIPRFVLPRTVVGS